MAREKGENLVKESLKVPKLWRSGRWSRSSDNTQESPDENRDKRRASPDGSKLYNNLKKFKDDF